MATHDQPDGKAPLIPGTGRWEPLQRSTFITEGIRMANRARRLGCLQDPAKQLSDIDLTRMVELIESCRAHAASITELAAVTSDTLDQCYQYEESEAHLGQCCELVRQVLEQTESDLAALGVVSHDIEPRLHAEEIVNGCELQRRSLPCAMHVVRATSAIVGTFESNSDDHVLLALHDLESGIMSLIDRLASVTKR